MTKERKLFQDDLMKRENEDKLKPDTKFDEHTTFNQNVNFSDQKTKKSKKEDKIYENFVHEDTTAINNDILYNSKKYNLFRIKEKK